MCLPEIIMPFTGVSCITHIQSAVALAAVRVYAGDWTVSCGFHHFFRHLPLEDRKWKERVAIVAGWEDDEYVRKQHPSKPIRNILGVVNVCYIRVTYAGQPRYYPVLAQHQRVSTIKQLAHLNSQPLYMCVLCWT